jgi:hypothetical protein
MVPAMLVVLAAVAAGVGLDQFACQEAGVSAAEPAQVAVEPVEEDIHELMEYLFALPYERLAVAMEEEPDSRSAWTEIKSDALITAEAANLLIMRPPEESPQSWKESSALVRGGGARLYAAAKKRDYKAAREHYEAMIKGCNVCHKKFADEYEIEP